MTRLSELFADLKTRGRTALMPFVTAGDPSIAVTDAVIRSAAAAGADLFEIGVPYSDPIADGPVISTSYQRAIEAGFRLPQLFELGLGLQNSDLPPRVTMVSYSIVHRMGIDAYLAAAIGAGYCGAIVPDLLVEEASPMRDRCRRVDFDLIQLVTPTTPRERQKRIADLSSGFLYIVSVAGITGERSGVAPGLIDNVAWLREQTDLPLCIGFGISGPEIAAQLAPHADGLIVGSAIVRRIAEAGDRAAEVVGDFVQSLRQAIDSV